MTTPESFRETWRNIATTFFKLGITSYGGPAIMGIMQTELQEKRQWVSRDRFLEGLSLVNMLPGPAAVAEAHRGPSGHACAGHRTTRHTDHWAGENGRPPRRRGGRAPTIGCGGLQSPISNMLTFEIDLI